MPRFKYPHCLLAGICICLCAILVRRQLINVINIGSTHTEDLNRIGSHIDDKIKEDDTPLINTQREVKDHIKSIQDNYLYKTTVDMTSRSVSGVPSGAINNKNITEKNNDQEKPETAQLRRKNILLFTYMRGGSSFLGSIFESHPEAIYWYESLGPFYYQFLLENAQATYNVWFDKSHTPRNIKTEETEAIVDYLDGMFGCDLSHLYPEALTHSFMHKSASTSPVSQCVSIKKDNPGCNMSIPTACHNRSLDGKLTNKCHVKVESAHQCYLGKNTSDCDDPELQPYINRLKCYTSSERSSTCLRDFENNCNKKRLSVTKVHRLSMQSVEAIIERISDVYIVYYVRDPRGIYNSRPRNACPIQSLCKQMKRDYDIFAKLKKTFPKRLQLLRYEDLANHSAESLEKLFSFLDEPIPSKTKLHLSNITHANNNSGRYGVERTDPSKTASAWREQLNPSVYVKSKTECGALLELLNYEK